MKYWITYMRIDDWLKNAVVSLQSAQVGSARLDCLILLEDAVGKDRSWLLAHLEHELSDSIITELNTKITRRSEHVPLAYIRGHAEFYGRTFAVDEHVLIPRPETETMIELLKALPLPKRPVIVDIGTGSGALAISARLELSEPKITIVGVDIDPACLNTAQGNAQNLGANVVFRQSDLLALAGNNSNLQPADCVLANLPYVPDDYLVNTAAQHEPALALFGGPDGLELYRKLFVQIDKLPSAPVFMLTESLPDQHINLATIAKAHGYEPWAEQDYVQAFHFIGRS